jgi:hypothetical protein
MGAWENREWTPDELQRVHRFGLEDMRSLRWHFPNRTFRLVLEKRNELNLAHAGSSGPEILNSGYMKSTSLSIARITREEILNSQEGWVSFAKLSEKT